MTYTGTLTAEQIAMIAAEREKWMRIGLPTERCDRPAAEAAVRKAYATAGLDEPEVVVWMDSPLGGVLASAAIKNIAKGDQLGGQLGGQLRDQLGGQLGGQLRDQLDPWGGAYWLAYLACGLPIADLEASPRLEALVEANAQVGWWWPMRGAVVLTDRPTIIARDQNGNPHNEGGPALAYADGYEMHSWHGVTVPDDFWGWDIERALSESNSEVRRCGIEYIGWDRITDRLSLVAEAPDPGNAPHTLRLFDLPDDLADLYDAPARILVCHNASLDKGGHRRTFGLPVPAETSDPIEAAASLFDVPPEAYRQMARAS